MNSKKVTSFLLTLLLLIPNIGITINVHYCGDAIASLSIESAVLTPSEPEGCCEKNEENKKESCCKNRLVHIEKKGDQSTEKIVLAIEYSPFLVVPTSPVKKESSSKNILKKAEKFLNYETFQTPPPLYQLYHQYIFYA